MTTEALKELQSYVTERLETVIEDSTFAYNELTLVSKLDAIVDVLSFLKDDSHCQFVCLIDICGVDYPERENASMLSTIFCHLVTIFGCV